MSSHQPAGLAQTRLRFARAVGEEGRRLFLIRRANQGDVFLRIFIEIFFTALAAQFYFLLLIDKYEGGSHLAQFFTGYRAGAKQIRFHLGFVGQKPRGQSQGGQSAESQEEVEGCFFHWG